jgi:hypothetical protein
MTLHLRKFDIASIRDDQTVVFIGMRGPLLSLSVGA